MGSWPAKLTWTWNVQSATDHVFDTTLKLYGNPFSTSTQRVAIVLKEKNVPFEFISIGLIKGEHKAPAFVPKQPFAQVPFISDEGFMLHRFQVRESGPS
ncbi:hypothetical protein FIBSPDRAFT_861358 [Athelia psychrophila]|uniref:glutathione transferase n=1 Tax=Athelia psychrophila TaxID=1759441 RepID=A0A166J8Z2_9AGAM|nr:hypothetical protein FIBSPDRAFT_861358 [Fibularhizoctonia sp. CBS 109695]